MNAKTYSLVTMVVFSLVALLQLTRIVQDWTVIVGGDFIPMWVSYVALLVSGVLAVSAFRLWSK
jgi:TRAP-type C4-dicarboxylate transport system permease small subunit